MNNDITSQVTGQNIVLKDRKRLEISGIKKIESLNNEEFLIDTKLGMLFVKGKELEMQQLDVDNGNLWISGTINLIQYIEATKKKRQVFSAKYLNNVYNSRRVIYPPLFSGFWDISFFNIRYCYYHL